MHILECPGYCDIISLTSDTEVQIIWLSINLFSTTLNLEPYQQQNLVGHIQIFSADNSRYTIFLNELIVAFWRENGTKYIEPVSPLLYYKP